MAFTNRIRLPFFLSKPQFPVERNVFRKANGASKLLSAIVRNTYEGKTDQLPEDWHRKLIIALAHDTVTIEDSRLLFDVVLDGDYEIDWQDFLNYPIAQAGFKIQTTPFSASNSNCQSCEEMAGLVLVDDYTAEVWDEDTTHDYPDIITANDTICCYPFVISISSFNTLYFTSVTVDAAGVLTATVAPVVPPLTDVLIATYRVTCADGSYDEANVYGNIDGTSTECQPPTNVQVVVPDDDTGSFIFSWTEPSPVPAGGYDYILYYSSDLFTPITSGNVLVGGVSIPAAGITQGVSMTFVVISKCAGGSSPEVQLVFNWPLRAANTCGSFTITYIPVSGLSIESASYMDCEGTVQNYTFSAAGSVTKCMLITPGSTVPVFFAASTVEITVTYNSLC